jgi:3-methyladenine DNA glycosylase AlkD
MEATELLAELAQLGTEQNRKIYRRHGVKEALFGVSFANLKALKRRLKIDQPLAEVLWASGNHDARVLATMIADPKRIGEERLLAWAATVDSYPLADALVELIALTPSAQRLMERWLAVEADEYRGRLGWHLLGHRARDTKLPDAYFTPLLATIERAIHQRPNRLRQAMNNALIAIGLRGGALAAAALATAERIGPVAIDHGETGCKTPDAVTYITKGNQRRRAAG